LETTWSRRYRGFDVFIMRMNLGAPVDIYVFDGHGVSLTAEHSRVLLTITAMGVTGSVLNILETPFPHSRP